MRYFHSIFFLHSQYIIALVVIIILEFVAAILAFVFVDTIVSYAVHTHSHIHTLTHTHTHIACPDNVKSPDEKEL